MRRKALNLQLLLVLLILLIAGHFFIPGEWRMIGYGVTGVTLFVGILAVIVLNKRLVQPLDELRNNIQSTTLGVSKEQAARLDDESSTIMDSFGQLTVSKKEAARVIENFISGDLEQDAEVLAHTDDALMQKINQLRELMLNLQAEEDQRKWAAEGFAHVVNILRQSDKEKDAFYQAIISNLVERVGAMQGILYVTEVNSDKQRVLVRKAAYAFDVDNNEIVEIHQGDGLVGQALNDHKRVYITDIPDSFSSIGSALGSAPPRCILVQPLIANDEVYGVVEIASFQEIEVYKQDFLERVGENIASAVYASRMARENSKMLTEYQVQSEDLKARDEEMRQNMEELQATQEQMARKSAEVNELLAETKESEQKLRESIAEMERLKALDKKRTEETLKMLDDSKLMLTEILDNIPEKIFLKDAEGKFFLANSAVAEAMKMTVDELIGTSDFDFFEQEVAQGYRDAELEIVNSGKPKYFPGEVFKDPNGEDRILQTTKMPFFIRSLDQMGLLGIQFDITEIKNMERDVNEKEARYKKEIAELKKKLEE